jgi:hypothetical protein
MTDECTYGYLRSVFQTFTDKFTDGFNPLVCHTIIDGIKSVGIFQAGNFFFGAQFPYVKPSVNVFFSTYLATEYGITDERKADGRILLV